VEIIAVPNAWTYLNGLSAIAVCFIGYLIGIVAFARRTHKKNKVLTNLSIFGFSIGTFYLDITISFFTVLIWGENLVDPLISGYIAFFAVMPTVIVGVRLSLKYFAPKIEKPLLIFGILLTPIYYVMLFGIPLIFGDTNLILGGYVDEISLLVKHEARIILWLLVSAFLMLSIGLLGGGFFKLSRSLEGPKRKRSLQISIGFIIFGIGNLIDMTLPAGELTTITLVPTRIALAVAYWLIFRGFLAV
jgi:hypothetical protein